MVCQILQDLSTFISKGQEIRLLSPMKMTHYSRWNISTANLMTQSHIPEDTAAITPKLGEVLTTLGQHNLSTCIHHI